MLIVATIQPDLLSTQPDLCLVYYVEPVSHSLLYTCSTTCIFVIANHQPLFHTCITLPVDMWEKQNSRVMQMLMLGIAYLASPLGY